MLWIGGTCLWSRPPEAEEGGGGREVGTRRGKAGESGHNLISHKDCVQEAFCKSDLMSRGNCTFRQSWKKNIAILSHTTEENVGHVAKVSVVPHLE